MDNRYKHILSTVADRVGLSLKDAEEFMLESDQVRSPWYSLLTQTTHEYIYIYIYIYMI